MKMPPTPFAMTLDPNAEGYTRILGGPPATASMRSGQVILHPGESVGRHSTGDFEEVLIVWEGAGEMLISGGAPLPLRSGTMAYCPPRTEHDVTNTGTGKLRYVFIVAQVQ